MGLLKRIFLKAFVLTSFLYPSFGFATIGQTDYGYGAISKAMGGTGVAFPVDSIVSSVNPAGLAFVTHRLDAGLELFMPPRSYEGSISALPFSVAPGNHESRQNLFFLPNFGYAQPIFNARASWGIAAYANGLSTAYSSNFGGSTIGTSTGAYGGQAAGLDLKQMFINLGLGVKVHPRISLGGSLVPVIQVVDLKGVYPFQGFSPTPANLSNRGNQYSFGVGTRWGLFVKPVDWFRFGMSYQPKISMSRQSKYSGGFPNKGNLDIPSNGTIGFSVSPAEKVAVNLDFQKIWFSNVPAYRNPNTCNPSSGQFCLGIDGGSGFGWNNPFVYKLGLQWIANKKWTWRMGFAHTSQVVSKSQVIFNIIAPATVQDHYTAGFTYIINPRVEVNTNALYVPQVNVSGKNQFNPSQTIKLQLEEFELGASITWKVDA